MAPIGSLSVDSATSTGPIKLSWSMQVPQNVHDFYFDIEYGYDVQVYDSQVGQWTNLLTGTQATNTVFNGAIGHTYQFRVLPFYGYMPDNHRLNGLFTNPVTVTVADLAAPVSTVSALPAVQTSPNFTVRWSGSDNVSAPSALRFDVQYRQAPTGPWTDWQKGTRATSATFNGQAGHAYDFRSRAYDEANNAEAYPSSADTSTAIALSVDGVVRNMRNQPVPLAAVAFSPAGIGPTASGLDGQYTEWVLSAGNYTFGISRPEFGSLPSMQVTASAPSTSAPDAFLPPSNDLVKNGQFEGGNLTGWTLSAQNAPALTAQPHSGGKAVALGGNAGVESSLPQLITLPPSFNTGTLSYLARAPLGGSDPFTVTVSGDQLISVTTPSPSRAQNLVACLRCKSRSVRRASPRPMRSYRHPTI
jgi:hypothetical protein